MVMTSGMNVLWRFNDDVFIVGAFQGLCYYDKPGQMPTILEFRDLTPGTSCQMPKQLA